MMVHALVASVVQVIMVHVVSPARQGSTVVQKYQVVEEHFLLLFVLALLYFVVFYILMLLFFYMVTRI
jgi:hypothetical protein